MRPQLQPDYVDGPIAAMGHNPTGVSGPLPASGEGHFADERWIVGDVDRDGCAPDPGRGAQRPAQVPQAVRARAEVVVDEHRVGLAVLARAAQGRPTEIHEAAL